MLLFKSTALNVCISGSNERDILRLRTAVEQWGEHNLETNRLTLWLKTGVRAARVFPTRNFPLLRNARNRSRTHHHAIVRQHLAHLSGLHPFGLIISSLSNNGASTSPSVAFGTALQLPELLLDTFKIEAPFPQHSPGLPFSLDLPQGTSLCILPRDQQTSSSSETCAIDAHSSPHHRRPNTSRICHSATPLAWLSHPSPDCEGC